MSSFAKGFITLLLSICVAMSAGGCAPSENNNTLVSSIYQNEKFDFRRIGRLEPIDKVLKKEGLTIEDVENLNSSNDRFLRNEKLQLSDVSAPCRVIYVFVSETDNRFWGGEYIFEPENEQEYQSLCSELYTLLSALPEPTMGKAEPLRDGAESVDVVWEGVDRSRLQVTTGMFADTDRYYISLAIRPIYIDHSPHAKNQT